MMKRLPLLTFMLLLSLFLAGCGNDNSENTDNGSQNSPETDAESAPSDSGTTSTDSGASENSNSNSTDAASDQDDMKAKMDQLAFSEIKVEVSYGKDREYEAEIEQDPNQPLEAEVEDELNGVYTKGKEAFDDIYPKAKELDITTDSTEQEIIDQVLSAFDLEPDYEKFEVDLTFNDGTVQEFENKKK